jgi:RND superfamily putative drug exporter
LARAVRLARDKRESVLRAEASLESTFARLGAWLARRARLVLIAAAVLLVVAGLYGSTVEDHLPAGGLEVPGSESDLAARDAAKRFGIGSADVLVLYANPDGPVRDALFGSQIIDALQPVLEDPGVVGATTVYETDQAALVSLDGKETLVLLSLAGTSAEKLVTFKRIEPLLREVEEPIDVKVGGLVAFTLMVQAASREDAAAAERFALPIAALLTLFFFRSVVAALVPVLLGAVSLAGAAALVRLASNVTEISIFAMSIGAFLGLGLSIDYALLMVQRFREELGRGRDVVDAVAMTLDTAGRAVWISGLTVVVSLAALTPVPLPVLRSVTVGGVLVVLSALAAALLLLPALLGLLGPRINVGAIGKIPDQVRPSPFWHRVGGLSMRHPVLFTFGCVVLLLSLATPMLRMKSAMPDSRALARQTEARLVDEALGDPRRFDPGGAAAIPVVVDTAGAPTDPANLRLLRAYAERLAELPGVEAVRSAFDALDPDAMDEAALAAAAATEPTATKLRRMADERGALLVVEHGSPWRSDPSANLVRQVRAVPRDGLAARVGGPTAQMVDMLAALGRYGPISVALVASLNFLILLAAFRSIAVPVKAILMNALSLSASYGLLVWVFQDGHFASWLGFDPVDGIDPTIPVVMFAVVFGLSMDYEVFLLSRIQEEWRRTRDNRTSVLFGVARTGRTITSAALVLLVVVGAFAAGDVVYVKQIGIGIAAAIALDVTIVRALLVPAAMQLLGDWNWWAPKWMRRNEADVVAPSEVRQAPV